MADFKHKFESSRQDWATPDEIFDRLNTMFGFTLDVAADADNAKCASYFTAADNALTQTWRGVCWLNPPYGGVKNNKLSAWVEKAYEESLKIDCTVVMLIPARTNTVWWHAYCMRAAFIFFICGRPKFGNARHGLPQPLAIVVFNGDNHPSVLSFVL